MSNVRLSYKVLMALMSVLVASFAAAQERRFAVTPLLGYRDGGRFTDNTGSETLNLDAGSSYALALNMAATEGGEYELFYSRQASQLDGTTPIDMNVQYLHIGGTTPLGDNQGIEPYAAAGIGATRFSPQAAGLKEATRPSFSLGGGVKVPLGEYFALRFELRGYVTWLNGKADLFCVSSSTTAGCLIQGKAEGVFQYEALGGVAFRF